ncbi:MAG TPA: hypothetical protein EYG85_03810 [Crocinitomix sp.]|nr:hypothetical protein [Crocinitomix sp.]
MLNKVIILIGLLYFSTYSTIAQCVMCKAQAEAEWEESGSSINTGILYIMIIPYIILFIVFRKKIFKLFKDLKHRDF